MDISTQCEGITTISFSNPVLALFHKGGKELVGVKNSQFMNFKTYDAWKNQVKDSEDNWGTTATYPTC